nr:unnamed protein product [Callosobruchus chinensis]CAH7745633.1 unnamed protein product [Callosobruchus chinensis]
MQSREGQFDSSVNRP